MNDIIQAPSRYKKNRDYLLLENLFKSFYAQAHLKDRLKQLVELGESGVERWLQVELAMYLHENSQDVLEDWWREEPLRVDPANKKAVSRTTVIPDFILEPKGTRNRDKILLELKVNLSDSYKCLRNLAKDQQKYHGQRNELFAEVSSVWLMGLHCKPSKEDLEWLLDVHDLEVYSRPIRGTGLHFSISRLYDPA